MKKTFIVKDQFQRNSGLRSYEINLNKIVGLEVLRIVPELPFLYVVTETELPTPIRHPVAGNYRPSHNYITKGRK